MNKDAIVTLKILIQATGSVKAMRFGLDLSVGEVIKEIRLKNELGGKDHGLFVPGNVETGKRAYWLARNRTLRFYGLTNNSSLEFKKMHRPLKIALIDDTKKMVVVDDSAPVSKICSAIGEKIGLKSWEEFSLRRPSTVKDDGTVKLGAWLNDAQTLHEQDIRETDELVYAKRYFYNDDFVDKDDPFSLHLLYVGAQKNIVDGEYPVTRNDARDFAAIQMQVVYGDHDPTKHKEGWIDVNQFFPPAYRKDKKLEKEVYTEHRKLVGTKDMNAKYRYVQLVRSLKSYGITYFKCKQKIKDKKKFEDVLIGVTRSNILKVDPKTMSTVREWDWSQMRRWSSIKDTFTLDFGDYEDDYVNLICEDAEGMSTLIAGYIELILRTRVDPTRVIDDDDDEIAEAEQMEPNFGLANQGMVMTYTAPYGQGAGQGNMGEGYQRAFPGAWPANNIPVTDLDSALRATRALANELGTLKGNWGKPQGMSEEEWAKQFQHHKGNLAKGLQDLLGQARLGVNNLNRNNLDARTKELVMEMMSMATAARNLAAYNEDNAPMLDGAKAVADSLAALMGLLGNAMDDPDGYAGGLEDALLAAEKLFQNADLLMNIKLTDAEVDKGAALFLAEIINQIDLQLDDITMKVRKGADRMPEEKKKELLAAANKLQVLKNIAVTQMKALAPALSDPEAQKQIEGAISLGDIVKALVNRATALNMPQPYSNDLTEASYRLAKAMEALLTATKLAERQGATGDVDLTTPVQQLVNDLARVRANIDDPRAVIEAVKAAAADQNDIITATSTIAKNAESIGDTNTKERLTRAAAALTSSIKNLMEATRAFAKSPDDPELIAGVMAVVGDLEKQAMVLIGDAGTESALNNLRYAAKVASASLIKLSTSSAAAHNDISDPEAQKELKKDVKATDENVGELLQRLKVATNDPRNFVRQNELLEAALFQLPGYSQHVSSAKQATQHITDPTRKQELDLAGTETSNNLRLLAKAVANVSSLTGDSSHEAALGNLDVIRADLEAAEYLAGQGKLPATSGQTKDAAAAMLQVATQQLNDSIDQIRSEAQKGYSNSLGGSITEAATALGQVATAIRPLAAGVSADRNVQKEIIASALKALDSTVDTISIHRALAIDKDNVPKKSAADRSKKQFDQAVHELTETAKGRSGKDLKDAEKVLEEAAQRLAKGKAPQHPVKSDEARAAAKALSLAVDQLTAAARSNPDSLGFAGRIVAATGATALDAAASQIKTSDPRRADDLKSAAQDVASKTRAALSAARDMAEKGETNPSRVTDANSDAQSAIALLAARLGGSALIQAEIESAAASIAASLARAESGDVKVVPGTAQDILSELLAEARNVQRSGDTLVAASKKDAAAIAVVAPDLAETVTALVNTAKAASISSGAGEFSSLDAARIVKGTTLIAEEQKDEAAVHRVAKQITQAAANLVAEAKAKARVEPDAKRRAKIVKHAQALINATTRLAQSASVSTANRNPKDIEISARGVRDAALDLEESMRSGRKEGDGVPTNIGERINQGARTVGMAVSILLRQAGLKGDVASAQKEVISQLADLVKVATELSPAIQAVEETIKSLTKASAELDGANTAAQQGRLTADARGRNPNQLLGDAGALVEKVGKDINQLLGSLDAGDAALASNSAQLGSDAMNFSKTAIALAASTADEARRGQLLGLSKALTDALLEMMRGVQGANMNDPAAPARAQGAAGTARDAANQISTQLQAGAQSLAELDELAASVRAAANQLSADSSSGAPYGKALTDLQEAARNIAAKSTALLGADKQNAAKTRQVAKDLAKAAPQLVSAANACAATTSEASAKKEIISAAAALSEASAKMISHAKAQGEGKQEGAPLLAAYNDSAVAGAQLLAATKKGAVGELMLEKAMSQTAKATAKVATANMFAQAAQLNKENLSQVEQTAPVSLLVEKALADAKAIVAAVDGLPAAAKSSDEKLGEVASAVGQAAQNASQSIVVAASRLDTKSDQQAVLASAKNMLVQAQSALNASRTVSRAPGDTSAAAALNNSQQSVQEGARSLRSALESSSAQLTAHEKGIEIQRQQILSVLRDMPVENGSTPQDVVKAAREVIQSSADMYFAETPDASVAAAQKAFVSVQDLVSAGNAAKKLSDSSEVQRSITNALQGVGQAMVKMLEDGKRNHDDDEVKKTLEEDSDRITASVNELIVSLKKLPNTENISLEEKASLDLDAMAEQELLKCAQIIADAAKTLLNAKPKREPKKTPGIIDQQDINDAILDAATAIATATGALVQAAATAQQERVRLVKETPGGRKYMADPAWANGLISAAQSVAGSVTQLVKSANESVQGKAQEEALVASARAVATATAHLVAASRAKSDPDSRAQMSLKNAAKAVSNATSQLVSAANAAAQFQQEDEVVEEFDFATAGGKAKELEQQMKILRLEKELEKARQGLNSMRKARYGKK